MDALGDEAHDRQLLDQQPLLFGGERTVWTRGEDIRGRTAQRFGLPRAGRLRLGGGTRGSELMTARNGSGTLVIPCIFTPRCSAFGQTRSWVAPPGRSNV
jgi:hypothetical protein